MSRSRKQRDSLTPSMFPFLAVLLCTMGALVLILMLVVVGAQSSASKVAKDLKRQQSLAREVVSMQETAVREAIEASSLELERQRLALQHVEEHIQETLDELEELKQTHDLLVKQNTEDSVEEELDKLTELEKQLVDAKQDLVDKELEQDDSGDKPIFAIIPYDGRNGTHRRPIYLECVDDKLVIQPEGIELSGDDLKPPFGPGNPLDAALRTIRSQLKPEIQSLTSSAYPLLVVRPSGIRAYVLARQAMSGWDDQFGYELIAEDLELVFPPSKPGLDKKIASALDLARQRQASIAMAMPRNYRGSGFLSARSTLSSGRTVSTGPGGASGSRGTSRQGRSGQGRSGGGYSFETAQTQTELPQLDDSQVEAILGYDANRGKSSDLARNAGRSPSGSAGPPGTLQSGNPYEIGGPNSSQSLGPVSNGQHLAGGPFASGESRDTLGLPDTTSFGSDPLGPGSNFSQSAGGQSTGGQSTGSFGDNGSTGGPGRSASPNPTGPAGGMNGPATPGSASGQQIAMPSLNLGSQSAAASLMSNLQQGGLGQPANAQPNASSATASSNNRSGNPGSSGKQSAGSGSSSGSSGSSAGSVASSKGRNWAWQRSTTRTPVVRGIKLLCTQGAWILPATRTGDARAVIDYTGPPVERAEALAQAIRKRVDRWGLALEGGYWQPEILVQISDGGRARFEELQHMFEGSGIPVRLVSLEPTGAVTLPRGRR
ncbi:MAG TPA: hypothetical protein DDW52_00720 [Planctomycetaceae bacterium]|nr:hypothetical protein [Planctomycetaceae bacterium]